MFIPEICKTFKIVAMSYFQMLLELCQASGCYCLVRDTFIRDEWMRSEGWLSGTIESGRFHKLAVLMMIGLLGIQDETEWDF